eukprot:ctg_347.g178
MAHASASGGRGDRRGVHFSGRFDVIVGTSFDTSTTAEARAGQAFASASACPTTTATTTSTGPGATTTPADAEARTTAPVNASSKSDGTTDAGPNASYSAEYLLVVRFATERHARIALRSLEVDPELRPDTVQRTLQVHGRELQCRLVSGNMRALRTSIAAFYDFLGVTVDVLAAFADQAPAD